MSPKLIITRPVDTAKQFAIDVQVALGRDVACIFSPAYTIIDEPLSDAVAERENLIFTSPNGVRAATRAGISKRKAWCVGDRTMQHAVESGFDASSANGDVNDLFELIMTSGASSSFVHIAGDHTIGDLSDRLTKNGIPCRHLLGYRQVAALPTPALSKSFEGSDPLVFPLFSARAALILGTDDVKAPIDVVAMSPAVSEAAIAMNADRVVTAKRPRYEEMVALTCDVLTMRFDREGRLESPG